MRKQTHAANAVITNNPAKFSLFLKAREIKQIGKALDYIMLLPKAQRDKWVEEHGEFMNDAFNDFIDSSSETFDADSTQFDDEMVALSQDLVVSLQETFNRVHKILSDHHKLKS